MSIKIFSCFQINHVNTKLSSPTEEPLTVVSPQVPRQISHENGSVITGDDVRISVLCVCVCVLGGGVEGVGEISHENGSVITGDDVRISVLCVWGGDGGVGGISHENGSVITGDDVRITTVG